MINDNPIKQFLSSLWNTNKALAHIALLAIIGLTGYVVYAALADERDGLRDLDAALTVEQARTAALEDRINERNRELASTLHDLEAERKRNLTPRETVREVARYIPLPAPLEIIHPAAVGEHAAPPPLIQMPIANAEALRQYAITCQECEAKVQALSQDLADERGIAASLKNQRDAAVKAARGGGFWRRVKFAGKVALVGAGVGYVLGRITK